MEREERIKYAIGVFSFLMRKTVSPSFAFPGGKLARDRVFASVDGPGEERIIDYCLCQVFALSRFGTDYLRKWNVSHSFGEKAAGRFLQNTALNMRREDRWLEQYGFSRRRLALLFSGKHPLHRFIFPEYEEITKKRMRGTEAGFYICTLSTLLWTPFSPACRGCSHAERCREACRQKYPELYRIRTEIRRNE
jgi:hypothetical protein